MENSDPGALYFSGVRPPSWSASFDVHDARSTVGFEQSNAKSRAEDRNKKKDRVGVWDALKYKNVLLSLLTASRRGVAFYIHHVSASFRRGS
jgi:hypothetical protein